MIPISGDDPGRRFYELGMLLGINTDDPQMFGNSLAKEYCMLEEHYGFSHTKIRELIVQGIESSWLPASRITQPAHELVADSDWQG